MRKFIKYSILTTLILSYMAIFSIEEVRADDSNITPEKEKTSCFFFSLVEGYSGKYLIEKTINSTTYGYYEDKFKEYAAGGALRLGILNDARAIYIKCGLMELDNYKIYNMALGYYNFIFSSLFGKKLKPYIGVDFGYSMLIWNNNDGTIPTDNECSQNFNGGAKLGLIYRMESDNFIDVGCRYSLLNIKTEIDEIGYQYKVRSLSELNFSLNITF